MTLPNSPTTAKARLALGYVLVLAHYANNAS
jgi:hypothetical protein